MENTMYQWFSNNWDSQIAKVRELPQITGNSLAYVE